MRLFEVKYIYKSAPLSSRASATSAFNFMFDNYSLFGTSTLEAYATKIKNYATTAN